MNRIAKTVVVLAAAGQGISAWAGLAHVEALVVDEVSGEPVKGVEICGSFEVEGNPWDYVKGHPSPNFDYGRTDFQGRCKLKGKTNCGSVSCFLESGPATHYWRHRCGGYDFKSKNLFGVWQPDNVVVTIKLQRVEHPIPLWVKRVGNFSSDTCREDIFTKGGGRIAFDFLMGEWLPPVGNGRVADVEFVRLAHEDLGEAENDGIKAKAYRDGMSVKFLGADNGLLEMFPSTSSWLRIRTAPENGYCPDYLRWEGQDRKLKWDSNYIRNKCFCFRIRTRRDERGNVIEAYYGKIYGDFKIAYKCNPFVPVASVCMFYYLNPTSLDRNLEWDRKTNLCPNPGDVGHSVGDRRP